MIIFDAVNHIVNYMNEFSIRGHEVYRNVDGIITLIQVNSIYSHSIVITYDVDRRWLEINIPFFHLQIYNMEIDSVDPNDMEYILFEIYTRLYILQQEKMKAKL